MTIAAVSLAISDAHDALAQDQRWSRALLKLARAAGDVANFCDHLEHCEDADRATVSAAARTLRQEALALCEAEQIDAVVAYANRLEAVERRSPLFPFDEFDARKAIAAAETWIDLQQVQARHDRLYHLDVVGLHKQEQLRHCALHLAKLVAALADAVGDRRAQEEFSDRRLPDMVIFALKLSTLMGDTLDGHLPR
jgi:hypothetical protein